MNQQDNIKKALQLLVEYTGPEFLFSNLSGNQNRQKRRQLYNALHGHHYKSGNVPVAKLKHDFIHAAGLGPRDSKARCLVHTGFARKANELLLGAE